MTQEEYQQYLQTEHWKDTRNGALERAGSRCQVCNSTAALEVHHRTYERLGCERPEDLTVLCGNCHGLFHERTKRLLPVATLGAAIAQTFREIDSQFGSDPQKGPSLSGIPTGWIDLDLLTAGFPLGTLWAVASRAGGGKTTFLTNFVRQVAVEGKCPTLLLSAESSPTDLTRQLIAEQSRVDAHQTRRARLTVELIERLMNAGDVLRAAPVFLSSPSKLTLSHLVATVREYQAQRGVQIVLVDSLDAIEPENPRELRHEQIATISRTLKALARELNVLIVVSVRLGQRHDTPNDSRPCLTDLKQNWPIEHEADAVLLLHRPGKFNYAAEDNFLEVVLEKHRNGPTGAITLTYIKQCCRLENHLLDADHEGV